MALACALYLRDASYCNWALASVQGHGPHQGNQIIPTRSLRFDLSSPALLSCHISDTRVFHPVGELLWEDVSVADGTHSAS